jgi:hypothetical protein
MPLKAGSSIAAWSTKNAGKARDPEMHKIAYREGDSRLG